MNKPVPAEPIARMRLVPNDAAKNNFDLLRFLLATAVIYSHCFVLLYAKMEDVEPLRHVTRNQLDFGGIAVSFSLSSADSLSPGVLNTAVVIINIL